MEPEYDADGVKIYCGDCMDVLPELEAESVNCCVTSPPSHANLIEMLSIQIQRFHRIGNVLWASSGTYMTSSFGNAQFFAHNFNLSEFKAIFSLPAFYAKKREEDTKCACGFCVSLAPSVKWLTSFGTWVFHPHIPSECFSKQINTRFLDLANMYPLAVSCLLGISNYTHTVCISLNSNTTIGVN